MTTIRIEAEEMLLEGYRLESKQIASGGQLISLALGGSAETGTASFEFPGMEGYYQVVVGYFDEADGDSELSVSYSGSEIANWRLDQQLGSNLAKERTKTSRTIATDLLVRPGDLFEIRGSEDRGEPARVDYIEFIPVDKSNEPLNVVSANDSVNSSQAVPIKIEAEKMTLNGYRLESKQIASGGQLISLALGGSAETGTASFEFPGTEDYYQVVVGYFDEADGASQLSVSYSGSEIANWQLDQQLGSNLAKERTKTSRTIATDLLVKPGDLFEIRGSEDRGEPARVDYIEFIPVDKGHEPLNSGSGNDGVDYSQAVNGIFANLNEGKVLKPLFGTIDQPKILSIGDSITAGKHKVDPTPGAYRIKLWNNFVADGLNVNFVGSQYNGPTNLKDKEHEGHPGWTINQITALVDNGLLAKYQPDVVLLMIGTNDILRGDKTSTLKTELSQLIDQITGEQPNAHLLVSSIAPLDSSIKGKGRADIVKAYNDIIPQLVDQKAGQGQQITYVNAGGSLSLNDLVSDGVHPSAAGYNKLGKKWYDALVERETLIGIENIKGTAFNDRLTGDGNNNKLEGGDGSDTLTGGGGADSFIYENPNQGFDVITDFRGNDRFVISASGFGGGLVAGVALMETASATGTFVSGENPTTLGNSANFLYETDTGELRFDRDGIGSAIALTIATLSNLPFLSREQFTIV